MHNLLSVKYYEVYPSEVDRVTALLKTTVRDAGFSKGTFVRGAAASLNSELQRTLCDALISETSTYSPIQWLWYTRRHSLAYCLEHINGPYSPYCRQLIEIASRFSNATSDHRTFAASGDYIFPLDPSIVHRIVRVQRLAEVLSRVQQEALQITLGAELLVQTDGTHACHASVEIQQALEMYTQRMNRTEFAFVSLGMTINTDAPFEVTRDVLMLPFAAFIFDCPAIPLPVSYFDPTVQSTMTVPTNVQFMIRNISFRDLADLHLLGDRWLPDDALMCLFLMSLFGFRASAPSQQFLVMLWRYGYVTLPDSMVSEYITPYFSMHRAKFLQLFPTANIPHSFEEALRSYLKTLIR